MLNQEQVVPYLMQRRLLTPAAIVDGSVVVRDASSRNRNYRVEVSAGTSYLLKQGIGPHGIATVAHEAKVYGRLAQAEPALAASLPAFHGYDPDQRVLILELVSGARDMRTRQLHSSHFSPAIAAGLGTALGTLHRVTPSATSANAPLHDLPWAVLLHRPDFNIFRDASAASLAMIRIVQQTAGFAAQLDELRNGWRRDALIHNDVKWDNILVPDDEREESRVRLVDWESALPGDPSWDAGSVLGNYLSWWLFSIPVTGTSPPRRFPELARSPLDAMKPAINAFWLAYADCRGLTHAMRHETMMRLVRFAAARLLQTAFEACQMMMQITGNIVLHLQLSANILERTEEAAAKLLGLPVSRRAT